MDKEVRGLIRDLKRIPGVTVSGSQHPKVSFKGDFVVSLPSTPSDARWRKNTLAALKRAGIDFDAAKAIRPANGQSPPPLPDFKEEALALTDEQATRKQADKLMREIQKRFGLVPREARIYGHGVSEYAADIILAYAQETGQTIPHLNHKINGELNEPRKQSHLSALRIKKAGVDHNLGREPVVTRMVMNDVAFLNFAWNWFEANEDKVTIEQRTGRGRITITPTPAPADPIPDPDEGFHVETPDTNGHHEVTQDDLAMRVLAKLIRGGTDEDEAISLAKQIASR